MPSRGPGAGAGTAPPRLVARPGFAQGGVDHQADYTVIAGRPLKLQCNYTEITEVQLQRPITCQLQVTGPALSVRPTRNYKTDVAKRPRQQQHHAYACAPGPSFHQDGRIGPTDLSLLGVHLLDLRVELRQRHVAARSLQLVVPRTRRKVVVVRVEHLLARCHVLDGPPGVGATGFVVNWRTRVGDRTCVVGNRAGRRTGRQSRRTAPARLARRGRSARWPSASCRRGSSPCPG